MFKVVVGHSEDVLSREAISEVINQIELTLGEMKPQAGVLFCSIDFDHSIILTSICNAFPGIELMGCTTDGELSSVQGFSEDSLTLIVFASDEIEIRAGAGPQAAEHSKAAGRMAAQSAQKGLNRFAQKERFAVILSDPLNAGLSEISQGMAEVFGLNFPTIGAAAAAHSKQRKTFQFYKNEILTDSVVILLFAGPVCFSCGIQGGHAPMGGKEVVTMAKKNVLYRIGDQTALDYFRRYIGDKFNLFMNYCLAVFEKDREGFYVRSAPFSDPETGTVTLNGCVPEGAWVQIGTVDKDIVVRSCEESIQRALATYPGSSPAAALVFSCAGRKMIMGTQIVQEARTAKTLLNGIPFSGFYAYGEFGPMEKGGPSLFHGTTFVTLLIGLDEEE